MTGGEAGDRERWDEKHAAQEAGSSGAGAPDAFVLRALALVPVRDGARALDLAAGRGRHALELAQRGFDVEAWDVSPVALASLQRRAADLGLAIETRALDLLAGDLPDSPGFDLLVLANFLDRPLYERLSTLVRPGGHLVLTTFTTDRTGSRPSADYCLAPGELGAGLPGFETLLHEERGGRAGLLAQRSGG